VSTERLHTVTGWVPQTGISDGISATVRAFEAGDGVLR
jgi:hypothetical protein